MIPREAATSRKLMAEALTSISISSSARSLSRISSSSAKASESNNPTLPILRARGRFCLNRSRRSPWALKGNLELRASSGSTLGMCRVPCRSANSSSESWRSSTSRAQFATLSTPDEAEISRVTSLSFSFSLRATLAKPRMIACCGFWASFVAPFVAHTILVLSPVSSFWIAS